MTLSPEGGWDTKRFASKHTESCKKVNCEIPYRLRGEPRRFASEDVESRMRWIVRSHVDWREEQNLFIRVWMSLSNQHFKTLRGNLKGKTQRRQYRLAVGLSSYNRHKKRAIDETNLQKRKRPFITIHP